MRIATKCKRALAGFFCNGLATKHYLVLFLLLTATNPVHAQTVTLFTDNFDGAATGWVVDPLGFDTATTGQWQIANPTNTNFQNGTTTSGVNALVTQANNTSDFDADIDNGSTSVQSPVIAIPAGATTATLTGQYYLADCWTIVLFNLFKATLEHHRRIRLLMSIYPIMRAVIYASCLPLMVAMVAWWKHRLMM